MTPAHHTDALAELVCSNSFRSDDAENNAAVGSLLHAEMRALDSLILSDRRRRAPRSPRWLGAGRRPRGFRGRGHTKPDPRPSSDIEVVRERVDSLPASGLLPSPSRPGR